MTLIAQSPISPPVERQLATSGKMSIVRPSILLLFSIFSDCKEKMRARVGEFGVVPFSSSIVVFWV